MRVGHPDPCRDREQLWGSATPGIPMWTGSETPSARRALIHESIAAGSKHSWVVM